MNRTAVALLAALESAITAAIGLGIALVPLTALWAAKYNLTISWLVFWRAACDIWLLGHGVDLTVALDTRTATTLGLPGASIPFALTIAALGYAMLVVLLGARIGRRAARTAYPQAGVLSALAVYWIISIAVTLSARASIVSPSRWQGFLLPVFVLAIGVLGGAIVGAVVEPQQAPSGIERSIRDGIGRIPSAARLGIAVSLRAGAVASALTVGLAALMLALTVAWHFSSIVSLYERLGSGALGGAALTIGQLAFLPNLVVWTASWLIGPGFALGAGSSISPAGTQLGPIPGVPILGALPESSTALGFAGILAPVLAGCAAALLIAARERRTRAAPRSIGSLILLGAGSGAVAGVILGILAWWSAGAIGPGRLAVAGPNPWLVGAFAALEIGIASIAGMIAGSRSASR